MRLSQFLGRQMDRELENRLVRQHADEIGDLLPVLGPLFGIAVVAFTLWDELIDAKHAALTFAVRVALVLTGATAYWPNRLKWSPMFRNGVIYCTHTSAIIVCEFLLTGGFRYGLAAIAASCFTLSVSTLRLSTFFLIGLPPFVLFIVLAASKLPLFDFVNGVSLVIFAMSLAAGVMLVIRFLRQKAFLLERELTRISQHDSLTGIYNRRYLTELAEREVTLARRHRRALSVLMLDIDRFKRINDTYGHDIGDRVIKAVTEACLAGVRSIDHVGRIGGEEFVCVLPETDVAAAQACAERLRQTIENSRLPPPNHDIGFTVSVGVAVLKPTHQNWQALLKDADVALYQAKESGRNRVVTSTH